MHPPCVRPPVAVRQLLATLAALVLAAGACSDDGAADGDASGPGASTTTEAAPGTTGGTAPGDGRQRLGLGDHPDGLRCDPRLLEGLDIPAVAELTVGPTPGSFRLLPGMYAAHWTEDDVVVEIHVSGTVVVDLVGERTDQVSIDAGDAILWYSAHPDGGPFVQLRAFTDPSRSCRSFDVTVWQCAPLASDCDQPADEARAAEVAERVAEHTRFVGLPPEPSVALVAALLQAAEDGDVEVVRLLGPEGSVLTAELVERAGEISGFAYEVPAADGTVPFRVGATAGEELDSAPPGCELRATIEDGEIASFSTCPP